MASDAQAAAAARTRHRVLAFIADYQDEHGWAPTVAEIGEGVGLASKSSVHGHLLRLRDEGEIVLGGGPRMIKLTNGHIELRPIRPPNVSTPIPIRHVASDGRLQPGR